VAVAAVKVDRQHQCPTRQRQCRPAVGVAAVEVAAVEVQAEPLQLAALPAFGICMMAAVLAKAEQPSLAVRFQAWLIRLAFLRHQQDTATFEIDLTAAVRGRAVQPSLVVCFPVYQTQLVFPPQNP
jgi:hypothetical protein